MSTDPISHVKAYGNSWSGGVECEHCEAFTDVENAHAPTAYEVVAIVKFIAAHTGCPKPESEPR